MLKKLCSIALLFCCLASLKAQPLPEPCEYCFPPWGTATLNLAMVIGSNANYHSVIPLDAADTVLKIENPEGTVNDLLMVGVGTDGQRYLDLFRVEGKSTMTIDPGATREFTRLHLMSLTAFNVQSSVGDQILRYSAQRPVGKISRIKAKTPSGEVFTLGVTGSGNAYYPVAGYPFGTYDDQSRILTREDGTVFELAD